MTRAVVEEIIRDAQTSGGQGSPKKALAVILFVTLVLGGASNLGAQEKLPLRLTVQDAVAMALRQNPQVQIAAVTFAESTQDKNITRAALLPQATLAVSDSVTRENLDALLGKPYPDSLNKSVHSSCFRPGRNFLHRCWISRCGGVSGCQAWHGRQPRGPAVDSGADHDAGGVAISGCLQAEAEVQAARSRVQLAQALYDQAADLQKSGAGTGIDTVRANVELQNEKQRLLEAETTDKTTMYGLVRLLNLDPQQSIEFADALSFLKHRNRV